MAVVTQTIQDQVSQLYIAYFGRAPEAVGFAHWANSLASGMPVTTAALKMADSYEFRGAYNGLTPDQQVTKLYQNVLDRTPPDGDPGKAYWVNLLNTGTSIGAVAWGIVNSAFQQGTATDDGNLVLNKVAVAEYFAVTLGSNDLDIAATAFDGVTKDVATVQAAEDRLYAEVNPTPTYTLTTGIDNITATTLGVTYTGVTGAAGAATLNTGDILTGIGGTNTFNITGNGGDAAVVETTNVQNVNVRAVAATTIDQVLMAGVTNAASSGSLADVSFTNGQLSTTYGLVNTNNTSNGNADLSVSYQAAAGTADTALLSINNAGGKVGSTNVTQTITTTAASGDIEAVSLATTGTNRVALGGGSKVATFTVTGDGTNTVTVNAAATTFKLDASASTGTNTVDVGGLLSATSTVIGGSAADTLKAQFNSGTQFLTTITDVETLELNFAAGATLNAKNVSGTEALKLSNIASTATFTNLSQDVDAINIGTSSVISTTGATKFGYATGSSSDVVLTLGASPSSGSSKLAVSVGDVEFTNNAGALTVNSAGSDANDLDALTANKVSALTFAGVSQTLTALDVSATSAETVTVDATTKGTQIRGLTVDESLSTLTVTSGAGAATVGAVGLTGSTTTAAIDATFDVTAGAKNASVGVITVAAAASATSAASLTATLNAASTAGSGSGDGKITIDGFSVDEKAGSSNITIDLAADAGNVTLTTLSLVDSDATNITVSAAKDQTVEITKLVGTASDPNANTPTVSNSNLTSITASGAGTIDLFRTAPGGQLVSAVVGNTVVDATAVTGVFKMSLAGAEATNNIVVELGTAGADLTNIAITGAGADVITGGAGNDSIDGGLGNDTLNAKGGAANTIVTGGGADTVIVDTSSTNTINVNLGASNVATITATAGTSTVNIAGGNAANGTTVNASTSTVALTMNGSASQDVMIGGTGSDVLTGGLLADTLTGGAGRNGFVVNASLKANAEFTDSGATTYDAITDFGLVASAISTSTDLSTLAKFAASSAGGSNVDVVDINVFDSSGAAVAVAVAADIASSVSTSQGSTAEAVKTAINGAGTVTVALSGGEMTLSSTTAADVDTLAEWVTAAGVMATSTAGKTLAFVFGSDTYVFTQNGSYDVLVQLDGVSSFGSLVGLSSTTQASVGDVFII